MQTTRVAHIQYSAFFLSTMTAPSQAAESLYSARPRGENTAFLAILILHGCTSVLDMVSAMLNDPFMQRLPRHLWQLASFLARLPLDIVDVVDRVPIWLRWIRNVSITHSMNSTLVASTGEQLFKGLGVFGVLGCPGLGA